MTKKAAVLGFPIQHSLSPQLHGYWLRHYGINGHYEAIATPPEALKATLQRLQKEGYQGCNLTLPLKELVLPLLDEIDGTARKIGAVNTIIIQNGTLRGTNTDAYGFIENLQQSGHPLNLSRCVVLGAGGAARAVITGLTMAGARQITLLNRSIEKAQALANAFAGWVPITIQPWENRHAQLHDATLLVNTTSLGKHGQPPLDLELTRLPIHALVTDIVYKPLQTPLLARAAQQGNPTVDGLGMLLYQAQPAFEQLFGTRPDVSIELRELMVAL